MTTTTRHLATQARNHNHRHAHHAEVAEEAHGLLDRLSHSAVGEEAKEMVTRLRDNLDSLKESAKAAQEQLQAGFHATEKKIKQNPWTSVGITTAAGIFLGLLLARRRH
jgi:ElaB/YqjD/DUF883 family membrane-anchored ribosome-binding protein